MKKIIIDNRLTPAFLLGLILCMGLFSCDEYPNAYKHTDGIPEVLYVRTTDAASADSLLDGAFMDNVVCLVGNNLRSVHELYFNDQQAILNTSYITDHTLIVTVPNRIPVDVTDKIYLVAFNGDTVTYDFKTKVPGPVVNSISCEYAPEGSEAVLYGDYFLDDPDIPLEILMAGNLPVTEIRSIEKTQIRFVIPEGAMKGYINVKTLYGTSRSKFQYKDDRGMILDWDNLNANGGWREGKTAEEGGISGKYVVFKGDLDNGDWNEDNFSFNLWGVANGRPEGDFFDASNLSDYLFKFEINILAPWSADGMQIVFTPWSTTAMNSYYGDDSCPRALWIPWATTGSYMTDGWITVTIPMTDFKYTSTGAVISKLNGPGNYGGLSMFVWNGGVNGTKCTTEMWLDNMRVVPVDK
ncbi:MAG: glycan-binding surface protein [Candidatus Azobacteroides sp.]|nr:glycan-binding surface protein [Candidatus Azobacteroides sp.]